VEAGKYILGDCRTADHVAAFEYEHTAAGTRQICRVRQAVVAPTDDDGVVLFHRDLQSETQKL
jgi:hypothetical protein